MTQKKIKTTSSEVTARLFGSYDKNANRLENEFGVRLENLVAVIRREDGLLGFRPLTVCPFDRDAILPELMSEEELSWLNRYHEQVYCKLEGLLDEELREWLFEVTKKIGEKTEEGGSYGREIEIDY